MFATKRKHLLSQASSKVILASALALSFSACEKGAGSFSVLTTSNKFTQSDVYTPRKVDVLFVVDNSNSMQSSQDNLANNFSSFITNFISKDFDFRIAVTTTDTFYSAQFPGTCLNSNGVNLCDPAYARFRSGTNPKTYVINRTDYDFNFPSEVQRLKDNFKANALVGTGGSGDERAFSSFKSTLSSSLNSDFRRSDAFLAIVILSDEEDFSHPASTQNESYLNPNLDSVASYNTFLASYTGGKAKEDYSVSTISVLDETCRQSILTASGKQKVGQRYIELADLTGGTKSSLCDSFDTSLDNISNNILLQAKPVFKLPHKPIVSSIVVIINDVTVPKSDTNGWAYDAVSNTVTIYGTQYVPQSGQTVQINSDPDITAN